MESLIKVRDQPELVSKLLVKIYLFGRKNFNRSNFYVRIKYKIYKILDFVFVKLLLNSQIPPTVFLGDGTKIYHPFGIIIHGGVRIGENVILRHQITIGNKKHGENDVPCVSDKVEIGAGAKILGSIMISKGTIIGANAVVTKDIRTSNSVVVGIPAQVLDRNEV